MKFSGIGFLLAFLFIFSSQNELNGQHSVAREWNEVLLEAIRNDFARPTVHARNLFHSSVAMYDCWAAYEDKADTYFFGKTIDGYTCFDGPLQAVPDVKAAQEEAMSYAAYRLLIHRFMFSPNSQLTIGRINSLFLSMGYNPNYTSENFVDGDPAALGNYIARCLIEFGRQDGSNEDGRYENLYYAPVNGPLAVEIDDNCDMEDPNRWQPLSLSVQIDQAGNILNSTTLPFLSPEWGLVTPFALSQDDLTIHNRDGNDYYVYHDPGPPPYINLNEDTPESRQFKWNFALVSVWGSHLDPRDNVMIDISPASIGNITNYPTELDEYDQFYDLFEGGDASQGHDINPVTGQAYEPQMVPRGDYARVLAEFWADGPDSETPPGHWFTILNYVNEHPQLEKRWRGQGDIIDDLEWDVKSYLMLGGAMHDCAISAWGIKGWYDYLRPVSAVRSMACRGQCSDPSLDSYDVAGIPLYPGYIELVEEGDPLAGFLNRNVGKIKLYSWRGPDYIFNPSTSIAGVGWILAEDWWPYQRPSFVSPPFAGYLSGHSTYSRAGADILSYLTGSEYFPGGMGEFVAPRNDFLVFEQGPSQDIILQWATYRDASDQTSLSRIWGGIHPPADDLRGRAIGAVIAGDVTDKVETIFFRDLDNDGFFAGVDCDDNDPMINPGVDEIPYNGVDEDCDPDTPDDDVDQDGFDLADDCDDNNAAINPSQMELIYNGIDDDCDPNTLDDDIDQDGFDLVDDCDDNNPNVNPAVAEIEYNGIDDDCDPNTLDDDIDQDGFDLVDDCDDNNANVNPAVAEIEYNGIDDDCDPNTLDDDIDQDGFDLVDDCDDNNPNVNPSVTEIEYNGIDDDCDPNTLDDDLDQDGFDLADDCDDNNANINPAVAEIEYNGIDDDCDPNTFDDDIDQDGFDLANDCDDNNEDVNPSAIEIEYNGLDDDCDPSTLDDDLDQDGFMLAGDCDDNNLNIYPGAIDIPDNDIDEDCNGVDLYETTNMFPNPVNDVLTVRHNFDGLVHASIMSVDCKFMIDQTVEFINRETQIDFSQVPSGLYILRFSTEDGETVVAQKIYK